MEEKRKRREKINQHRATRTAIHLFSILPGRHSSPSRVCSVLEELCRYSFVVFS